LDEDVEGLFDREADVKLDEAEGEGKDFVAVAKAEEVPDCRL